MTTRRDQKMWALYYRIEVAVSGGSIAVYWTDSQLALLSLEKKSPSHLFAKFSTKTILHHYIVLQSILQMSAHPVL